MKNRVKPISKMFWTTVSTTIDHGAPRTKINEQPKKSPIGPMIKK